MLLLYPSLKRAIANKRKKSHTWQGCSNINGWQGIDRILEMDPTPSGKTPRSCPATYIGIWDTIRKLFAGTVDARLRGYCSGQEEEVVYGEVFGGGALN